MIFTGEVETALLNMKLEEFGSKETKILKKKLRKIEGKIKKPALKGRIMSFLENSCIRGIVPFLNALKGDSLNTIEQMKNGFFKFQSSFYLIDRLPSPRLHIELIKKNETMTLMNINIVVTVTDILLSIIILVFIIFLCGGTISLWVENTIRNNIIMVSAIFAFLFVPITYFRYILKGLLDVLHSYKNGLFDEYITPKNKRTNNKIIFYSQDNNYQIEETLINGKINYDNVLLEKLKTKEIICYGISKNDNFVEIYFNGNYIFRINKNQEEHEIKYEGDKGVKEYLSELEKKL